jgi:hypothetical protein
MMVCSLETGEKSAETLADEPARAEVSAEVSGRGGSEKALERESAAAWGSAEAR